MYLHCCVKCNGDLLGSEFENIIWSEIGSGFGEPRGSPLSKFPRDSSEQRWRKRNVMRAAE